MTDVRTIEIEPPSASPRKSGAQGGAAAIYGFVHQLIASISHLVEAQFGMVGAKADLETVTAILEPAGGGDLSIEQARRRVLQFKHRSRAVSVGDLAKSVLPDLFRAHCEREAAAYELHTTNGLSRPGHALVRRLRAFVLQADAGLGRNDPPLAEVTADLRVIFDQGKQTETDFGASLARFVARLIIAPSFAADQAKQAVLAFLGRNVTFAEDVERALDELVGYLAQSASVNGATISVDMLLARLGLPSVRQGQPAAAAGRLADSLAQALARRDFDATRDVREPIKLDAVPLTLVTGLSGHGKSWALYRLAAELARAGKPAVLVRAGDRQELDRELRLRIGGDGLDREAPLEAGLLGQIWRRLIGPPDAMITILWEGCRDATILQQIHLSGGLGPGLALVAEVPGAQESLQGFEQVPLHEVGAFSATQLFDALRRRGVSAGQIPQQIRQMLKLPVLCGIYATLAVERPHWDPQTEYRVLEAFWDRGRERAGKLAGMRLKAFARLLLAKRQTSASDEEIASLGFGETELEALIAAGWLSDIGGRWSFAHDRLLTWAIAMALVADVEAGQRDVQDLAADVIDLQDRKNRDKAQLTGLRFLLMDVVWLLAALSARTPDLVDFLMMFEPESAMGSHALYSGYLSTAGLRVLPALELRAARIMEDDADRIEGRLVGAFREFTLTPEEQAGLCTRLWDGENAACRSIAVSLGRQWPLTHQRDVLWADYCAIFGTMETNSVEQEYFQRMEAALKRLVEDDPAWLATLITAAETDDEHWLACHLLSPLDPMAGRPLWATCRTALVKALPTAQHSVLIECAARFGDADDLDFLTAKVRSADQSAPEALAALAEIDPACALALVETRPPAMQRLPYGRYWLDRLLDHDAEWATTVLEGWLIAADPSGEDVADLWSRAEERVPAGVIACLLDRLAEGIEDIASERERDRRHDRLALLGSLTLDPDLDPPFHAWRGSALSRALRDRAIGHFNGAHDAQYVEVRRLLRRIGGSDYQAMVLHALAPDDLKRAHAGILTSILLPSPAVIERLSALIESAGTPSAEADGPLLDLWRTLLDLDPDRWRPRLLELLRCADEASNLLGLHLLEEYPGADDDAQIWACFEHCDAGSKVEQRTMDLAGNRGAPSPAMIARAIQRLDGAALGTAQFPDLNVLLEDPSPAGRTVVDRYLAQLEHAKSRNSVDSAALAWRIRQDDVPPALWRTAERMMNTGFFSGDRFVASVLKHNPARATDVLLDRAFATPDTLTTAQPDAISLLATVDKALATEAFVHAWRDHPHRRQHMARRARALDGEALDAMIESLPEEYANGRPSKAYRLICLELRHERDRALDRLLQRFAVAPASERIALAEPIAWAADGRDVITGLLAGEGDRALRCELDSLDRHWRHIDRLVDRFRSTASLETLENVIDIADPRLLLEWGDPLRLIEIIRKDPRLTGFAERRFVDRLNDIEGTRLKRVVIRYLDA